MLTGLHHLIVFGCKHKANVCIFKDFAWISKNDFSLDNWIEGLGLTSMDPILFLTKRLQSFGHYLDAYVAFNILCWPLSDGAPSASIGIHRTRDSAMTQGPEEAL